MYACEGWREKRKWTDDKGRINEESLAIGLDGWCASCLKIREFDLVWSMLLFSGDARTRMLGKCKCLFFK